MASRMRIAPYILVLPSLALPSKPLSASPSSDQTEQRNVVDDQDINQENKKLSCFSATNCICLSSILGGIGVATLLIASIVVPLVITLSTTETGTSSMITTTIITTLSSITTITSTTTTTVTDSTTTDNTICSSTCTSQQTCVQGTCVGIGYLSCTLTWSQSGDGDIVVATPNDNIIYWKNKGPSNATDYGVQDVDKTTGKGPENVFWPNTGSLPPNGTYNICFSQYSFYKNPSANNPIAATVKVVYPPSTILVFTKNFTSYYQNYDSCNSSCNGFLGSFTYP